MKTEQCQVLTFKDTGKRFSRSPRWAYDATRKGLLDKVIIPGCKRGMGVTAESVERLLRQSVCNQTTEGVRE
jgi:hypothetical protein